MRSMRCSPAKPRPSSRPSPSAAGFTTSWKNSAACTASAYRCTRHLTRSQGSAMVRLLAWCAFLLLAACLAGCSAEKHSSAVSANLVPGDEKDLAALVENHKGKVV